MSCVLMRRSPLPTPDDGTYLMEQGADFSTYVCPHGVLTCVPNADQQQIVEAFSHAIAEAYGIEPTLEGK